MSLPWIPADWPAPPGIVAGCTTREGGVSVGRFGSLNLGAHVGDEPARVAENRRRFRTGCGLPGEPAWLAQAHGPVVAVDPAPGTTADGAFTRAAGRVCAVMIADCLPVLLVSDDGQELAAVHAGWRGLASGVIEAGLACFETPRERLLAWLGPAISAAAFEVGDDVRKAFVGHNGDLGAYFERNAGGRWQADLAGLARARLRAAGLENVHGGSLCTAADPRRFFSFRRDGQCGRMAAYVYREAPGA